MTGKEELLDGVIGGLSQNKGKGHLFFRISEIPSVNSRCLMCSSADFRTSLSALKRLCNSSSSTIFILAELAQIRDIRKNSQLIN